MSSEDKARNQGVKLHQGRSRLVLRKGLLAVRKVLALANIASGRVLNFCYRRFLSTGSLHICQRGLDLVDSALGKETRLNNLLSFVAPFARVQ